MRLFKYLCLLLISLTSIAGFAQSPVLVRIDSVEVMENGFPLKFPFAGGLNLPQFSAMDLDGDGTEDLFVFDRAGNKVLTFLNGGTPNTVDYSYAPAIQAAFPDTMTNFVLARDFDCDGLVDLFTSHKPGLRAYRNSGSIGNPAFTVYNDTVFTDRGLGKAILAVPATDIPAIVDVDGDGDTDILTFDPAGNFVEWHQNNQVESTGNCAGMAFNLTDECWGNFQEGASDATITLGIMCRRPSPEHRPKPSNQSSVHAGSTLSTFDEEGDGVLELLLGDLVTADVTYLHNAGTPTNADMDSTYIGFPKYDTPIKLDKFVATYIFDANNDGKKDLVAAPNENNAAANYQNVWYYQNFAAGNGSNFSQIDTRFLQRDMIDMGTLAFPSLFDYNNDGLLDLFVGNFNRKTSSSVVIPGIALYENVGTATDPAFNLVTRDFEGLSTAFGSTIYGMAPTFVDLDGDGDKDMVIGDDGGFLHYFENIAATGQTADFVLSQSQYNGIDIGNFSIPIFADLDRDGDQDLVIGEMGGTLNYFENTGSASAAVFSSSPTDANWGGIDTGPVCCTGYSTPFIYENASTGKFDLLVGTERGDIWYYQDIESQSGTFARTSSKFGGVREGGRTAVAGADLNQDGRFEWIIGNLRGGLSLFSETGALATTFPNETPKVQIDIHPNPSNGPLHISIPPDAGKRVRITALDLQGRVVLSQEMSLGNGRLEMETSGLAPGAYILRFDLDGRYAWASKWMRIQ